LSSMLILRISESPFFELFNIIRQNKLQNVNRYILPRSCASTALWGPEDVTEEELETCRILLGRGVPNVEESLFSSSSKVTFARTGVMNPDTKNHVKIYMPQILAQQGKRNGAKVRVTCVYTPSVDITKGTNYTGARIRTNLKKHRAENDSRLSDINEIPNLGRRKWDTCYQYEKTFSKFILVLL
ncbi:MAG: hypothetical protein Q4D38_14025, partial [Planctomycetia bacterium]|nr:hypothetical protein [Planctomycetia bacterium]